MNISHNAQEHNSKQSFLRQLAYNQGKRVISYDSVHSLTNPNNHYTLLYPDLVQKLFDLSLHKNNIHTNISHSYSGLSEGIDKSSSLNISLRPQEILFFLQIVSLYQLELHKGNTSITYPSLKLAKLLGVDASCDAANVGSNVSNSDSLSNPTNSLDDANRRATILRMTAKLESLGLLKVFRRKKSNGMDLANQLVPVLPDRLYSVIKDSPTNLKVSNSSKLDRESNLEHILRTKLFVPIELEFMKSLFKNDLPSKYKLFFLNCMMSAYRSFKKNSGSNMLSFSSTSSELVKKNNISRSTLDRIFRYVKQQGDSFFLKVEHKYTRSDDIDCNRYDKSIFVISINPLVFPISQIRKSQTEEITEFNHDAFHNTNSPLFPDTYEGLKAAWSKKQPSIVKKTAHNNKNIIIKESNKDIDANIDNNLDEKNEELDKIAKNNQIKPQTFLKTSNSQHLESELCSLSSKSLKNSVKAFIDAVPSPSNINAENASSIIQDISDRKNKINITNNCNTVIPKQTASYSTNVVIHKKKVSQAKAINDRKQKDFRYFYPLSERDIRLLNSRANREFSNNFVNQLLLKLYIKYPEKRFKNRFIFLSYMVQILANEKHQGPLVNHTSFRFSCNIGTEKKNLLEYERYLNQIEDSLDTSKEMCVKKKIAGIFSSEVAYKILTKVQFKTNHDNSFITALIPSHIDLSERQIATLSQQLEAVYGMNGYYVQGLEKEVIQPPKYRTSDIEFNDKSIGILESSKSSEAITEEILENTVWHQIRKSLREELGEAIDEAWFSKAVATECEDTKTLTITMPTRFMADWVRNNYSHVIKRFTSRTAIKMVEYWYE